MSPSEINSSDLNAPTLHQHSASTTTSHDTFSITTVGFWTYLMTDCLLFATLFTTYAVLHSETFGGPSSKELFKLSTAFMETMVLLLSSFVSGFAMIAAQRNQKNRALLWLGITFLLGLTFVILEVHEFIEFVRAGHSWRKSAFLSSYFTLVGTHGLHVSLGLLWMAVMMAQIAFQNITSNIFRRLVCLNKFWHFLDVVWIFIFTLVYLLGVST